MTRHASRRTCPSTLAALALGLAVALVGPAAAQERASVVLVHGATMDGSAWRAVFDRLAAAGVAASVVQLPLESLDGDAAVTTRAIEAVGGPVVLVGHSYGGSVISAAGDADTVEGLVYVAATQPDEGESVASLNAQYPMAGKIVMVDDTHLIVDPASYHETIGADLPKETTAFLAASQRPTNVAVFDAPAPAPAWRDKPSWAVIATGDRTLSPELERAGAQRAGSTVTEVAASHLVHMSQPDAVARVILDAVDAVAR